MTDTLLKGKRFYCREWAFTKLLHCLDSRTASKTCGTLIMGGPGCGKTALCCELVWPSSPQGKQAALNSRLLAYHFCQAHEATSLSVVSFINSLVSQASKCEQLRNFHSHFTDESINRLLEPTVCENDADQAFKSVFLEPILACEAPEQPLMILVDSIDESYLQPVNEKSTSSQTIAELLAAHHASFPPWLLLVCSARKQSKIVTRMFTGFRKLSLDDLRKSHVVRDVQQYILCRLDAEEYLRQHLSRDTAEMLNQLHIKSNGCFLYLEKVLDGVAESFIMLREVREIPGTLNGLYLWLCQRLFIKKNIDKIRPILNVLLAAQTPLTSEDLYRCLLMKDTELTREEHERRLRMMSRILTHGSNDQQILFHHSFAEWLLDVKHCTQKYLCDASEGHCIISVWQLQHASGFNPAQVQELALHLVRAKFSEEIQMEHITQMLVLSGADVEKSLNVGTPKDSKVLKLLSDAGAVSPSMEASTTSISSLVEHDIKSEDEVEVSLPVDEPDGNGRTQLHTAAYRGDTRRVTALLSNNALLEIQDRSGQTALTLAARQGHVAILTALLQAGAHVDHSDHEGWTALRSAAWAGHTKVVSLLLNKGAEVDFADAEERTALRAACWGGHEDVVRLLIEHRANVNKTDHEGRTALIAAAYMGHVEIVEQLLDNGADIDQEDCDGRTALSVACLCIPASEGHERVVSLLLERGAEVDHTDKDGSTPLLVAAYEGHPGVCDMLLEWDADPDHVDSKKRTPLWAAASMGHDAVLQQLLFWGAAIDHIDSEGRTVLSVASAQGSDSVVRQLLDRGLDEMHRDNSGWTPLHLAAFEGHYQVICMLLEQGTKPNEVDNDGRIALIQAAQEGHVDCVRRLVSAGSIIDHKSHDGKTALRVAAVEGHIQVLEFLISAGADINYKDADGRTTLYVVALDGALDICQTLLKHKADMEAVDVEGRTPLHVAAWQGNVDVVRALVQHGARVNSVDNDRRTAVQSASWQGHENVVKLLLESGARVDHMCNQGATALCIAAQEGHEDVVKTLLSFQANPNHADQFGRTPYRVALKSGHTSVCKLLEDFGAFVPNGAKSRSNSSTSSGEIKLNTSGSSTQVHPPGTSSTPNGEISITTVIVQPPSATSPDTSIDRRKSYHSNNSSSKSSSNTTSSTNQSGQSSSGKMSRLDRECLTFTQQLQQCSMGKNRSRPISRVLSPVSEPQSPLRSPLHTPTKDKTSGSGLIVRRDFGNNINLLGGSPVKNSNKKQEKISATINIITNPHADMMSSVEEPVWQRNPNHPLNINSNGSNFPTTGSSSSSSSGSHHHHYQHINNQHNISQTSPTSDTPKKIVMGRSSLEKKSPDFRKKRNGIVTNPKIIQSGSSNKSSSSSSSTAYQKQNRLSHEHDTNSVPPVLPHRSSNIQPTSLDDLSPDILSPCQPSAVGGNSQVAALQGRLPLDIPRPDGRLVQGSFQSHITVNDIPRPDGRITQHGAGKAVRPNGLPIKKVNSPRFF